MATRDRPLLIGPASGPVPPYPLRMSGLVISGFGRGSKELGIPTANLPVDDALTPWISTIPSGVYFGWASLRLPPSHPDYTSTVTSSPTAAASTQEGGAPKEGEGKAEAEAEAEGRYQVYPMVMSIGYNPFYKNTVRSAEVHVLHKFEADFYGVEMRLLILGFIREEKDYSGLEALIADIEFDCEVARQSLAREGWAPTEVEVEISGIGSTASSGGDGGEKRRVRGALEAEWLIRPGKDGAGTGK
ncbi:Riboflavin kinase [Madurella mycetomatis]|uniref:Riboflavin kinase n=1 Tax=Madurella mycetomatis TaxID=100816 RepID=A0A175W1H3_9PEZI|nr:Riboflavin kinase [Madurella mycetomatis]